MLIRGFFFNHDNPPVHSSLVAVAIILDCEFKIVPHPSFLPDLSPSISTISKHKNSFDLVDVLPTIMSCMLWKGSLGPEKKGYFKSGYKALQHRCCKCVSLDGDYDEKKYI